MNGLRSALRRQTISLTRVAIDTRRRFGAALIGVVAAGCCCSVAPQTAYAQPANWTSTTDTRWNVGTNWSTGAAPNGGAAIVNFNSTTTTVNILLQSDITLNQINFTSINQSFFSEGVTRSILLTGANAKIDLNLTTASRSYDFTGVNLIVDQNTTTTFYIRSGASSAPVITLTVGNVSVSAGGRLEISRTQPNGLPKGGIFYANQINAYGDVGIGNTTASGSFTGTIGTFTGTANLYIRGNAIANAISVPNIYVNNFTSTGSLFVDGLIGTATVGNFTSNNLDSVVTLSNTVLTITNYNNVGEYRQYAGTATIANVLGSGGFTMTSGLLTLSNLNVGGAITIGGGAANATLTIRSAGVSRDIVTAYVGTGTSAISFGTAGTYSGQLTLPGPVTLTATAAGTTFTRSDALFGNGALLFGSGTLTAANVTYTSAGGLSVAAGTITLSAYGPGAGALTMTAGTVVMEHFNNNDGLTLTAGTVGMGNYNGAGAIRLYGGNVTITNLNTAASVTLTSGSATLVTYTHNAPIRVYGGSLTVTNLGSGQALLIGGSTTTNAAVFIRDTDLDRNLTVDWAGGTNTSALVFSGGVYGGQISLTGPVTMTLGGAGTNLIFTRSDALVGNGQLILNSGTLTATDVTFNSTGGLFMLTSSTIYLKAYGASAGALLATAGQSDRAFIGDYQSSTDLNLAAGIFTFTNYSGSGNVFATAGVLTVTNYSGGSFTLSGATTLSQNLYSFDSAAAITVTAGLVSITNLASGADVKLGGGDNIQTLFNVADASFDRNLLTYAGTGVNGTTAITFSVGTTYGGHLNVNGTVALALMAGNNVFTDAASIDGNGVLTKTGAGTLTATGFTASGGLRVFGGAVTLTTYNSPAALFTSAAIVTVTNFLGSGGLQVTGGSPATARILTYNNTGTVSVVGASLAIGDYNGGAVSYTATLNNTATIVNFNSSAALTVSTGNFTITNIASGSDIMLGSIGTTNVIFTVADSAFDRNITTTLMGGTTTIGIQLPVDTVYDGRLNVNGTVSLSNLGTAVFTSSQAVTGSGTLVKTGAGAITLSAIAVAGGLRMTAGTINATNYGSGAGVYIQSGGTANIVNFSNSNGLFITAGTTRIADYSGSGAVSVSSGNLSITDYSSSGALTITGALNFSTTIQNFNTSAAISLSSGNLSITNLASGDAITLGSTSVTNAVLSIFDAGFDRNITANLMAGTTTIGINLPVDTTYDGSMNLSGSVTLNIGGQAVFTKSTALTGAGTVVKAGTGTLTVTSVATSGGLRVSAGTINVTNYGNSTGSFIITGGSANIVDYASASGANLVAGNVRFNNYTGAGAITVTTGGLTVSNMVSSAAVVLGAAGTAVTATLGGANIVAPITVTAPTILYLLDGANVNGGVSLVSTLTLSSGASAVTATFGSAVNGAGGLVKAGAGTIVLAATNAYAGNTTILSGRLQIGSLAAGAFANRLNGGNLRFQSAAANGPAMLAAFGTLTNNLGTGAGQIQWGTGGGFAAVGGDLIINLNGGTSSTLVWGANSFVAAANQLDLASDPGFTLTVQNNINLADVSRSINVVSGTAVITGAISNTLATSVGTISKTGLGTLVLTANSTFTAPTTVFQGVLKLGNGGAGGGISSTNIGIIQGATLIVDRSVNTTLSALFGGGDLTFLGNQTLTIQGNASSLTGNVAVESGTLIIGPGGTINGPARITLSSATSQFIITRPSTVLGVAAAIEGPGSVTLTGPGSNVSFAGNSTFTGAFNIASGTARIGNGGTSGSLLTPSIVLSSSAAGNLAFDRSTDWVYTGAISGSGLGVAKYNTNLLTLNGMNSYAAPTTVYAGELRVNGALGAGGLTILPGAALSGSATIGGKVNASDTILAPGTNSTGSYFGGVGTIQFANNSGVSLTLASSGTTALYFDLAAPNASDRFTFDSAALAPVITNPITLTFNLLSGFGAYTYTLFSGYSGMLSGASMNYLSPSYLLNYGGRDYNAALTNTNGSLYLSVLLAANYEWTGTNSNVWDTATANWSLNGAATNYVNGGDVVFNDDPGSNQTVTLTTDLAPNSVLFNNANISYTLLGPGGITGATSLQIAGDVTLANNNSYTGGTVVTGTLHIGAGGATGSVAPGSTIVNHGYVEINRSGTYALTSTISGAGGVGIRAGTINLSGSNLYTGGTTVFGGATLFVSGSALPTQTVYVNSGGKITVSDSAPQSIYSLNMTSGTLDLRSSTTLTWLKFSGDSVVTLTSGSTLTLGVGTYGALTTYTPNLVVDGSVATGVVITGSGVLGTAAGGTYLQMDVADGPATYDLTFDVPLVRPTGATGILKNGLGSLYLTRDNSNYLSQLTYLYDGTIVIGHNKALGTGTLRVTVNSAFNTVDTPALKTDANGPYTIANGVTILTAGADAGFAIAGDSDLTITGTVANNNGNHTLLVNMSPGKTLTVERLQLSEAVATPRTMAIGGTGYGVFNLVDGSAGATGGTVASNLTINGSGTTLLTGSNGYGGATLIRSGTVLLGNTNSLGSAVTAVTLSGNTVTSAPSVYTAAAINISRNFNVGAGLVGTTASLGGNTAVTSTFSGNISFSQALNLKAVTGGTVVFSGGLTGSSGIGINKVGAGTVVLSAANNSVGPSTVSAGTLRVTGSVGPASFTVAAGAVLDGSGTVVGGVNNGGTLAGGLSVGGTVTSSALIAPGGVGTVGTMTLGALILGGGTLRFDLDGLLTSDKLWINGGALNVTSTTTLDINALGGFGLGTYNLIQNYSSLTGLNLFSLPYLVNSYSVSLTDNSGILQLIVSESTNIGPQTLVWTGATNAYWQVGVANWTGSTGTYIDAHGDHVNFTDSSSVRTLTIAGSVAPGSIVVDTAATYAIYGGPITGSTDLLKSGSGTLYLAGSHTFTGPTTVAGGRLQLGGDYVSNIDLQNATLQLNTATNQTVTGVLSGSGFLQKLGSGTSTLFAQNTFSGITSVDGGTLVVNHALSGTVFVNAGGAFSGSGSSLSHVVVQGGSGSITGTQASALDVSSGSVTIENGGATTGTITIDAGTLTALSGATVGNTLGINVNGGTFSVNSGATVVGNGQINVSGTLNADGQVQGLVVIENGGVAKGTGTVGGITVQSGGSLSVGHSVGTLTLDGTGLPSGTAALTLYGGADLVFEFNHATTTTGGTPGLDWDYIDLTGGGMLHIINANNQSTNNQITVHVDSWKLDNSGHGGGVSDGADFNGFNDAAATGWGATQRQTYYWKFIGLDDVANITVTDPYFGSIAGRFRVIDDAFGAGVFGAGNPFTRPENQYGKGTFKVVNGDFGQGYGMYIYYSAIPEPGSMLLTGIGTLAAGWYGKRRRKKNAAGDATP